MRTYLLGLLGGACATLGVMAAGYFTALRVAPQYVPAPALTSLEHLDEKLRFLRERPEIDPKILAVGSSITWRQFDGAPFVPMAGGEAHVLNGGTAFLKTHQTEFVTGFYLDHFKNVETVIQVTNIPDFRRCKTEPAEMFNADHAASYAFERDAALPFYLRYFTPYRYLRTAKDLPAERRLGDGDLALDGFGTGPIDTAGNRGLFYDRIDVDRDCIDHLVRLGRRMAQDGIRYVVVFAPVHPGYWEAYPDMLRETEAVVAILRDRLRPIGGVVIDMHARHHYPVSAFYDAFHMQWDAVTEFSAEVAVLVESKLRTAGPLDGGRHRDQAAELHGDELGQER